MIDVGRRLAEPLEHSALFYRDADEYLASTVGFVHAGLDAGGAVAVAVPPRQLGLIRAALADRVDEVQLIDMTQAGRNPGRIIATLLLAFADAHRDQPVAIIGEPIWPGRTAAEYPACVQHEALINLAFEGRGDVSILCPYDTVQLDPSVLRDAARTHPTLSDHSGTRASSTYAPTDVIDAANSPLDSPAGLNVATFLFNINNLGLARSYALAHALRLGLPAERGDDFVSAVAELISNSVRHGGGRGTLRVWVADKDIVCQVHDAGAVTDPLWGRRPAPVRATNGRGLLLVHQLADLVRVHAGPARTTVCVYFSS